MKYPKITEENFLKVLGEYVEKKYGRVIFDYYDSCPYDMDFDNQIQVYKQVMTWFVYERKNHAGKTILDEFVNRFVDDKKLRAKILQMKNITHDLFVIDKPPDANKVMLITSTTNGKKFTVRIKGNPKTYAKGRLIDGRIHPWDKDGTYQTEGIFKIVIPKDKVASVKRGRFAAFLRKMTKR